MPQPFTFTQSFHPSISFINFIHQSTNVMKNALLIALLCQITIVVSAQTPLPIATNLKATYDKGTRAPDGQPGKNYWQNHAVYDIETRFEPIRCNVSGTETIVYTNNSPDTLKEILFKLYPNIYKKGSPRDRGIEDADATDGVFIQALMLNNEAQNVAKLRINGTNMSVPLSKRLAPKQSIRINVAFSYSLNKGSHNRMGMVEDGAYFIAYFFPRVAVYDDIDGWNRKPYLGSQEFYNDFCDFKAQITVPKDYLVWATGDLKNCSDILTPKYCERLTTAETTDGITNVIDSNDVKTGGITAQNLTNIWRFEAKNVVDFVFATSNHYVWQSTSLVVDKTTGRRTRVDAVFNPKHKDYEWVVGDARKTVDIMSFQFPKWPFPYNHETVFDGLDQMEYPMMCNDNPMEDRVDEIELTDHEIFHTMFPFYMGVNETKYAWMDEGWATIGEWLVSPLIDPTIPPDEYGMKPYEASAGKEEDVPIMTLTTQLSGSAGFTDSYPKPALGYLYVKDLLGDSLFFKGLHHYIATWNGKHPMPYDFFNCMNVGSGVDMNWFWKRWFFDDGVPDLAIAKVVSKGKKTEITIESKGTKPVPIDLNIVYTEGSSEKLHRSVEVWKNGNTSVILTMKNSKTIKSITLGSTYAADSHKEDNVWEMK
jgi:hypothetical protein